MRERLAVDHCSSHALKWPLSLRSPTRPPVQIIFNGQAREVASHTTVAQLLNSLDMTPKYVAVEVNLQLVPRQRHAEHVLNEGDQLEVVTLVGGG